MKKRSPPSGRARLSAEERELWEATASNLSPLKRRKGRVLAAEIDAAEDGATPPFPPRKPHASPVEAGRKVTARPVQPPSPPKPTAAAAPALDRFDGKALRRLRLGQAEVEARIDLHGMRQGEAHAALVRFLMRCHADGLRLVLVITGKGTPRRTRETEDLWDTGSDRGVLKRSVPMWLAEPGLRPLIVSHTAASIRHGGEGALYIHLRNPHRVRR